MKCKANVNEVWKRVSAVSEIPRYWHGTKEVMQLGSDGSKTAIKVKFAFGGSGKAEVIVDEADYSVEIKYVEGPFTGTQKIVVKENEIEAVWDIKFALPYRILSRWNTKHFGEGTKHALQRLCDGPSQCI